MNKNGYFSHFLFGFIGLAILLLVIISLKGIGEGVETDLMLDNLNNASTNALKSFETNETDHVIIKVLYPFLTFIITATFEVTEAAVEYGTENPDIISVDLLLFIIILSLLAPPLWYCFLMVVSIFLIIKEWYLNKKEKRKQQ